MLARRHSRRASTTPSSAHSALPHLVPRGAGREGLPGRARAAPLIRARRGQRARAGETTGCASRRGRSTGTASAPHLEPGRSSRRWSAASRRARGHAPSGRAPRAPAPRPRSPRTRTAACEHRSAARARRCSPSRAAWRPPRRRSCGWTPSGSPEAGPKAPSTGCRSGPFPARARHARSRRAWPGR